MHWAIVLGLLTGMTVLFALLAILVHHSSHRQLVHIDHGKGSPMPPDCTAGHNSTERSSTKKSTSSSPGSSLAGLGRPSTTHSRIHDIVRQDMVYYGRVNSRLLADIAEETA